MERQADVASQENAELKWLQRGAMTSTKSERRTQTDGEGGGLEDEWWEII